MLPSCGWSQEIFIVEIGPRFRRSMSGESSSCSMNVGSFVIAVTTSEGPICASISVCGTCDHAGVGAEEFAVAQRVREAVAVHDGRAQVDAAVEVPPCAGRCDTSRSRPPRRASLRPSSIALSMKSAIFGLAKPESRAFVVLGRQRLRRGRASARGHRRSPLPYFGTTTAEALMQERPPLSEIEPTMTSMNSRPVLDLVLADEDLAAAGAVALNCGLSAYCATVLASPKISARPQSLQHLAGAFVVGRVKAECLGGHAGGDEGLDQAVRRPRLLAARLDDDRRLERDGRAARASSPRANCSASRGREQLRGRDSNSPGSRPARRSRRR